MGRHRGSILHLHHWDTAPRLTGPEELSERLISTQQNHIF